MDEITKQEMKVLKLIAEGWNNSYISGILFLAKRTVEHHINSIFAKLELELGGKNKDRRVYATVLYNKYIRERLVL